MTEIHINKSGSSVVIPARYKNRAMRRLEAKKRGLFKGSK